MYLLSCPNCQEQSSVTPAQAGDQFPCPKCGSTIDVPKLGQLRLLPQIDGESDPSASRSSASPSSGGTIIFATLSALALAASLMACYTGIRWATTEVDVTTESYLAEMEAEYRRVDAAMMIREYENMEKYSLDLINPYKFHEAVLEKRRWGFNTMAAGSVALLCGLGAVIAVSKSGK